MSRMLDALKRIEAKQAQRRPPIVNSPDASKQTPLTPPDALTTVEAVAPAIVEAPAESELNRLEILIQEELKTWQTVPVLAEEIAYSPPLPDEIESDSSFVEESLAQAELALAATLLSEDGDVYGEMAQYIKSQLAPGRPAVLLLTSPADGEGQTETLYSLAKTLVYQQFGEILLMDANFQHPGLSHIWGKAFSLGLQEVLSGATEWQKAVQKTDTPHLSILPNKGARRCEGKPSNARDWACLLEQLKTRYQLVLIDAPSLADEETAAIISQCDGIYLVIRLGYTTPQLVHDAVELIQEAGGRLLGSIAVGDCFTPN